LYFRKRILLSIFFILLKQIILGEKIMAIKSWHIILIIFFCYINFAYSYNEPQQADSVFKKALQFYKTEKYDSCSWLIKSFLKIQGRDSAAQYLVPLLIESSARQNDYALGKRLFQIYLKKFPSSPFLPRLWYLNGVFLAKEGNYQASLSAFSNAITGGLSSGLDTLVVVNVERICDKALTIDEIESFSSTDLHPLIIETLKYCEIKKLLENGMTNRFRQKAEVYLSSYQKTPHYDKIKELLDKEGTIKGLIQIGILVPLSGYEAELGKQILMGVQLAFEKYMLSTNSKVKLIICDTRSNLIETAKKTKELIDEHHVNVIIGPVLSQEAVVAGAIATDKDVLMITPTANEDGISGLGPCIFQMNVTLGTLGASIARYAIENCNIRDFAIISPLTDYATALVKGFKEEVEKKGREIVIEEVYEPGTKDFRTQLENIKNVLYKRWQQKSLIEKNLAGDVVLPASSQKRVDKTANIDSVFEIGGIFLPVEADDAVMLASQIVFHKIKTQILGSIGWHSAKVIKDGKDYVSNVFFSSNLAPDSSADKEYMYFKDIYKQKYGQDADRISALGYDAACLLIEALKQNQKSFSCKELSKILISIKKFKGASGIISFDNLLRTNNEVSIFKIADKKFIKVQ
jgi:branched-chain amino acid transport system substrate-binding protein